ncbi:MAG TPA: hypothetical protein VFN35_06765 [Ktedonobacteraceae bacterium]|nr:hypothetical protein [Ktedonobacteraceae bacterium]
MHLLLPGKSKNLIKAISIAASLCLSLLGSFFMLVPSTSASNLTQQHQQQATVYTSATKGTIAPFGVTDPTQPPPAALPVPVTTTRHSVKDAHDDEDSGDGDRATTTNTSTNVAGLTTQTGKLLQNFNGVSSLDSEQTNFGAEFEPPDQGLCVGNGFIVEAVNSAFTIYRTNGKAVLGPLNVNVLFDEGLTQFTSDPRCYFDKATNTWVAVILFIGTDSSGNFTSEARTDIAVNHTGDPTKPWTVYHLEASDDGTGDMPSHDGCPCLGDQPLIGIDQQNFYISTNEFSILGPEFNGAQIYALSKSQLFGLSHHVHFVHFDNLTIGGDLAASVQPASANSQADAGFFLNSLDPDGTGDHRIGVWALTNREKVANGGIPTLSSVVLNSEAYSIPPAAVQKGDADTIDSGDDRMQQAQFINGSLWGALGTTVTMPSDSTEHAGIAWFQVHPKLSHGLVSGPFIEHQGYVASPGNDVIYPAIQAGLDSTAAMVFTLTGANHFPSAAYAIMRAGHHSFGAITIAANGNGPYVNGTRWGDYSYAALDPHANRFWLATEYVPPVSSQTTDGEVNWGTRVFAVDGHS